MSEKRLDKVEDTIKDLADKVAHLDKSFAEINITLRDYAGWTKELSNTIKELSTIVRDMNNSHQQIPYERIRDIEARLDPVHDTLRRYKDDFISKREAHTLAGMAVFFIGLLIILLGAFGNYVLTDVSGDILTSSLTNKASIDKVVNSLKEHNKTRDKVLLQLHDHKEVP